MNYWNKIYDEILGYYFWEPQHLGRQKGDKNIFKITDYKKLIEHSKKLEVSLNHQLSLFFSLAPNDFVLKFFNKVFAQQFDEKFVFDITDIGDFVVGLKDFSQPDFWFIGEKHIIAVEMKLEAKSSVLQFIKYLTLNLLYQESKKINKEFHLIYLTKNGIENLWDKRDINLENLSDKVRDIDLSAFKGKGSIKLEPYRQQVLSLMLDTERLVAHTDYQSFGDLLKQELDTTENEIFRKLLLGIIDELKDRNLIS